jgi:hypothetical protein
MPSKVPAAGVAALGVLTLVVGGAGLVKGWTSTSRAVPLLLTSSPDRAPTEKHSPVAPTDPCDMARPPDLKGYVASVIPAIDGKGAPIDLAVLDVDLDGHRDIVVSRGGLDTAPIREQGVIEVLFGPHVRPNDACNTTVIGSAQGRRWASGALEAYGKMAIGDIDGNGCPDIVVGKFSGGVDVFSGSKAFNGTCRLPTRATPLVVASPRDHDPGFPKGAVGVAAVQLVDLDGDDKLDLVVARYHREYELRGVVQQVYWNHGGTKPFSRDAVWESAEGVTAAMNVLAIDVDGDSRTDVLFGTRALWNASGAATTGWGVWYKGGPGRSLATTGQILRRPGGDADPLKTPMVVDIEALSRSKPASVLVSSSLHWCNGFPTCEAAAKLEVYEWGGTDMHRTTRFAKEAPGNWLPASVGSLDNDPRATDVAVGFGCGKANQSPGHLRVYRSGTDQVAAFGYRDHLIRAVAIDDLRGGTSSIRGDGEIIFGSVSTRPANTGAITILFRCNET